LFLSCRVLISLLKSLCHRLSLVSCLLLRIQRVSAQKLALTNHRLLLRSAPQILFDAVFVLRSRRDLAPYGCRRISVCLPPLASYLGAASEISPYSVHILQSPHAYTHYNVAYRQPFRTPTRNLLLSPAQLLNYRYLECGPGWASFAHLGIVACTYCARTLIEQVLRECGTRSVSVLYVLIQMRYGWFQSNGGRGSCDSCFLFILYFPLFIAAPILMLGQFITVTTF
jgi:hypothetical protein